MRPVFHVRNLSLHLFLLIAATATVFAPRSAQAQDAGYQTIDYPGAYWTFLTAINDSGVAVGYYQPSLYVSTTIAFVYAHGTFTTINVPGTQGPTRALSINDDGQILVESGCNSSSPEGCTLGYDIYDGKTFSAIGMGVSVATSQQYATLSGITGFNDSGTVFGYYYDSNDIERGGYVIPEIAFGSATAPSNSPFPLFTEIDCPANYGIGGEGINDAGSVIGNCTAGLTSSGFVYSEGKLTALNGPSHGVYFGISNNGKYYVGAVSGTGFEAVGSTYFLVAPPGAVSSSASGVNNSDQVVGEFFDGQIYHGFISGPPTQPLKLLGCGCEGAAYVGYPIDVASGNMSEQALDYTTSGQNPLAFVRYYNSRGNAPGVTTFATTLGVNWRSTYDRYLQLSSTSVIAERANGQEITFTSSGGAWLPDSDVDMTLTHTGTSWTLTDRDDIKEIYTAISGTEAVLNSLTMRNGYQQTMAYNASRQLASVVDTYGRKLVFVYKGSSLETVTTPDQTTLTYGYAAATGGNQLISVSYDTIPLTSQTYQYGQSGLPFALTAIIDENGKTFGSWSYDQYGRGLTSQHAGGTGLVTLTYNSDGTSTVKNALGVSDIYGFALLQHVPKVSSITRSATSNTAAVSERFVYDGNGYLSGTSDWNGNKTVLINNSHGLPTAIYRAYGSPVVETTTITYDSTWVHLPAGIVTAGLTTTFKYDTSGEVLTKTLTDTTTTTVPYSTAGQTRTLTNSWANHLLASVKTPDGNLTSFGYDSTGALTSVTDALSHVTKITSHTGGGLPETSIDPNVVTTTLQYSPRQWLTSSKISGTGGSFTTNFAYDKSGNLARTTLPDNSYLANTYDNAHRLVRVTDALGEYAAYTLNALDDRTATNIYQSGGTLTRKHSGTFDDLGRLLVDTAGAGQTMTHAYDPNGNSLSAKDGLGHTTTSAYDALDRLSSTTDANSGITTTSYDAHDRIVSVKDANGNTTSYVRNGFGDIIQQLSPDSGKTIYRYDADGNLTQKLDASGVTTNYTYDALDRISTTTYPADTAENVTYTYDQTGTGFSFGIGRLTSATDAVGTLSRTYDERGNLLTEKRKHGTVTLTTSYSYDAASRIASITYPSGSVVTYSRDTAGQVAKITTQTGTVVSSVTHLPFGPVNAFTYGNGVTDKRTFDLDYRMTALADAVSASSAVQNLVYSYDAAYNLKTITDSVRTANSQTISYDALNRLSSATAVDYQTFTYTYDKVGNRLTEGRAGEAPTNVYSYVTGTNRLAGLSIGGSPIESFTYTPTGNIVDFMGADGPMVSLNYNKANRIGTFIENGTQIAQYTYDGFGQRLVKSLTGTTANGALFSYGQDGSLLEETNITGAGQADYIYLDGIPVGDLAPAAKALYYLHTDHLGTPQLATNTAKASVWQATYEPFGWANSATGTITQNLRLPGQYFDAETTSNHNGSRDYVAILGRYGQVDPIGLAGGINTYAYVGAHPLTFTDKEGLQMFGVDSSNGRALFDQNYPMNQVGGQLPPSSYFSSSWNAPVPDWIAPDYYSFSSTYFSSFNPLAGGGGSFTIDRYGNLYYGPTTSLGCPTGAGSSLMVGYLNIPGVPDPSTLSNFLSGSSDSLSGGFGFGGGVTWSPENGTATNFGLTTPGISLQHSTSYRVSPLNQ